MVGNLEPEEHVMQEDHWMHDFQTALQNLNWEPGDNIVVEIGGCSVSGIDGLGTKWSPVKGTVKYNKDAFIVIKNLSRDPFVPSQPNSDLKAHHAES